MKSTVFVADFRVQREQTLMQYLYFFKVRTISNIITLFEINLRIDMDHIDVFSMPHYRLYCVESSHI